MKYNLNLLIFLSVILLLGSCASHTLGYKSRQGIMLYGLPSQAEVYIDNRRIGIGAELNHRPIKLTVGIHKLIITDYKHYPYYSEFSLQKRILLKRKPKLYRKLEE